MKPRPLAALVRPALGGLRTQRTRPQIKLLQMPSHPPLRSHSGVSHLERTVELSGQPDQLRLHRLADGAAVAVQGHAVQQEEAGDGGRGRRVSSAGS